MSRKPVFWIVFAGVSVLCGWFAVTSFPRAFSVVNLDIRMDRSGALDAAGGLAEIHDWGPAGYRRAASFSGDQTVRSFVELEAGGPEAFADLIRSGLYSPYTWRVRHFKESETNETLVRFTPAGRPYGFRETLAEDLPGPSLDPEEARAIAESAASRDWDIDLDAYELAEQSQAVRPGDRTDHTFVYERPDVEIGEGQLRLRLVVAGDRLAELTHFIKVPEAFSRRFREMRSANDGIAMGAGVAMIVLYLMGGCGIGLFFLLRKRWVIWKTPVLWGFVVAGLNALVAVNRWPLAWMSYDTALSGFNFLLQQTLLIAGQFFLMGVLLTVSFMAAESLTRRAFPEHIQLWQTWRRDVASSPEVLGRTAAGFLLVGVFVAYVVAVYLVGHGQLGWWSPSESLFDPDILATYFPWLSSIAISLQAGFWEECLFRAVPIACAALIGERLGGRRWWIVGAFLLQAVVFGAGHANYPTQPSWARVAELILPSLGFGLIYLRFGLLPAIVLHYAFDVVLIAIPLWVSRAPGIWVDQSLVVVFLLVPLWVVVGSRMRVGRWADVEESDRNRAWTPLERHVATAAPELPARPSLPVVYRYILIALGVAGLAAWLFTARFDADAPPLETRRGDAIRAADQALAERNLRTGEVFKTLSAISGTVGQADRYVWQEAGPDKYAGLLGSHLDAPGWQIRYAQFEGDVAERAEEYRVWIDRAGEVARVRHALAEASPGASLTEDEARDIAHAALAEGYGLDPAGLREISAEPARLPSRTDWTFTYTDPARPLTEEGETRMTVEIAGSELADMHRHIHIPEQWQRDERNRNVATTAIRVTSNAFVFLVFLAGMAGAFVQWTRKRFTFRVALLFFAIVLVNRLIAFANGWPTMEFQLQTATPWMLQVGTLVVFGMIGLGLVAAVVGLVVGFVHPWLPRREEAVGPLDLPAAMGLGLLIAGAATLVGSFSEAPTPSWPAYASAATVVPFVQTALDPLTTFVMRTAFALLVFAGIDRFTSGWTRRQGLFSGLTLLLGVVLAGLTADTVGSWLLRGVLIGALLLATYVGILRRFWVALPVAIGSAMILETLREGSLGAYPGALPGAIAGSVLVAGMALFWYRMLGRRT